MIGFGAFPMKMLDRNPIQGDLERAFSWFRCEFIFHVCFNRAKKLNYFFTAMVISGVFGNFPVMEKTIVYLGIRFATGK
jgi:hypothetical protein